MDRFLRSLLKMDEGRGKRRLFLLSPLVRFLYQHLACRSRRRWSIVMIVLMYQEVKAWTEKAGPETAVYIGRFARPTVQIAIPIVFTRRS